MLLNLAQQMLSPISGLQLSQHSGAALIFQMHIEHHSSNQECVLIQFFYGSGNCGILPRSPGQAMSGQRVRSDPKAMQPLEYGMLLLRTKAGLSEQRLCGGLPDGQRRQFSKSKMFACVQQHSFLSGSANDDHAVCPGSGGKLS